MPPEKPHSHIILRDRLAGQRTELANERTFLSVIRTFLALVGAGAALIHLFDRAFFVVSGWVLIGVAMVMLPLGIGNYIKTRRLVARESQPDPKDLDVE